MIDVVLLLDHTLYYVIVFTTTLTSHNTSPIYICSQNLMIDITSLLGHDLYYVIAFPTTLPSRNTLQCVVISVRK